MADLIYTDHPPTLPETSPDGYGYRFWVTKMPGPRTITTSGYVPPLALRFCHLARCSNPHQIPVFVPFIGCLCGALAYDIFIYTGESPINKGEWNPKRLWNSLLVKLRVRERERQGDEESLDEKKDQEEEDLGPSPIARLHHRNSSSQERQSDNSSDITRSEIQGDDWVPPTAPDYGDPHGETYIAKPGQKKSRFPRQQKRKQDNSRFPREEEQLYTQEADMHDERNPDGRMRVNEPTDMITHAQKDGLKNMTGKNDTTVPPVYEGMPGKNGERIRNKNKKSTGYDDPK